VENTLTKDKTFKLPGKKILKKSSDTIEIILVEVTEGPRQRTKKGQKEYYSGKRNAIR
jgi:hypothetical protein